MPSGSKMLKQKWSHPHPEAWWNTWKRPSWAWHMHERVGEVGAGVGTLNCRVSTSTWACKWWQRDRGWDEKEASGGLGQQQYYRSEIVTNFSSLKKRILPNGWNGVYEYICIYVYINVCIYVSVNGMYVCVCTWGYICLHVCVCVCRWAWVQCEYIYIACCVYAGVCMWVHIWLCTYVCIFVCFYQCSILEWKQLSQKKMKYYPDQTHMSCVTANHVTTLNLSSITCSSF